MMKSAKTTNIVEFQLPKCTLKDVVGFKGGRVWVSNPPRDFFFF